MVCQALGLRLIIGAQTIMVPNVYDPSELRSDVNGKVVRYLHEEGTEIAKGDTFVAPGDVNSAWEHSIVWPRFMV